MREVLAAVGVAASVSSAVLAQSTPPAKTHTRHLFVTVTDRGGTPLLDLTAADFEISERGVTRSIERVGLARSPMRIALLVDTGDGTAEGVSMIRKGLVDFLDALPPQHEVLLVSTGRQIRVRVPPTLDRKKLSDTARGLFSDGGGTRLLEAVLDIDERFMKTADDRWPIFVIVTGDGAESSAGALQNKFSDWIRVLPARGIAAHGIVLKLKGGGSPEVVASHVIQTAGGRLEVINSSNALPAKLAAIAEQLARDFDRVQSKYDVAFQTDADNGPVSVGVRRQDVTLQMTNGRLR